MSPNFALRNCLQNAWARLPWKGRYIIQGTVQVHELGIQQVHKPARVQPCSQISTNRTDGKNTHSDLQRAQKERLGNKTETQFDLPSNTLKKQDAAWLITLPPRGALLLVATRGCTAVGGGNVTAIAL